MAGAAVGLTNLGRSCFINAGLQNLLSIEDLKNAFASCRTATGEAVTEVIRRMQASSTAVAPTPITNVHYGGRQEDLTEFVLTLLNDCPSCHPLLRGREVAALRCKHCGFERALPSEEFLCLQLPIDGIHSVETALDRYRNRIQEQEDVEEWCCPQFGCLEGDLALDNPLRVTSIQEWPSVLVLTLKRWRWRGAVVMLDHEVACNRTLDLDGVTYKLVSVATHIGASPTEGHYVAYRNMNGNFVRLDDQVVTAAYTAPERAFAMTPKEKAYMLVYIRDDRRELPPNKFRRLTANRTMVLDISEASDDGASDVIVEEDKDRGLRMNSSENVVIQHEDRDEGTEMKTFEATSEMGGTSSGCVRRLHAGRGGSNRGGFRRDPEPGCFGGARTGEEPWQKTAFQVHAARASGHRKCHQGGRQREASCGRASRNGTQTERAGPQRSRLPVPFYHPELGSEPYASLPHHSDPAGSPPFEECRESEEGRSGTHPPIGACASSSKPEARCTFTYCSGQSF